MRNSNCKRFFTIVTKYNSILRIDIEDTWVRNEKSNTIYPVRSVYRKIRQVQNEDAKQLFEKF